MVYYNPVLSGQRLLDRGPVRGSPDPSHLGNGKEELWKTDMASPRKELPPAARNLMITITGITKSYKEGAGGEGIYASQLPTTFLSGKEALL